MEIRVTNLVARTRKKGVRIRLGGSGMGWRNLGVMYD